MKKYDEISKKEVYICNCCGQSGMAVFIVSSSVRIAMGR